MDAAAGAAHGDAVPLASFSCFLIDENQFAARSDFWYLPILILTRLPAKAAILILGRGMGLWEGCDDHIVRIGDCVCVLAAARQTPSLPLSFVGSKVEQRVGGSLEAATGDEIRLFSGGGNEADFEQVNTIPGRASEREMRAG